MEGIQQLWLSSRACRGIDHTLVSFRALSLCYVVHPCWQSRLPPRQTFHPIYFV